MFAYNNTKQQKFESPICRICYIFAKKNTMCLNWMQTSMLTPTYLNVSHCLESCKDQHKSQPEDYDIDELPINFHFAVC